MSDFVEVENKSELTDIEPLVTEPDLKQQPAFLISVGVLLVLFCLAYGGTMVYLVTQWFEPDYIYGFFVVPFAAFLLWDRRAMLKDAEVKFCVWGIPVMLVGMVICWYADYRYRPAMESGTIVITLGGLVLLVGGWQIIRWAWPGVLFLFFMVSLPDYFSVGVRIQLQNICTSGSVFILQILGYAAIQQGNVIDLPNAAPLNVATACSGLRMLMLFFAACTGAALYVRRHLVVKAIMILSAFPIAIFCNTLRITATALVHMINENAGDVTHHYAGLVMMPLAIFILWLELTLIEKLFITEDSEEHRPLMSTPSVVPGVPQNRSRDE
ncbi:MAG: exosortase/archaeosortase family protein [Planctomycetia bacterium]|jgi:exosortase